LAQFLSFTTIDISIPIKNTILPERIVGQWVKSRRFIMGFFIKKHKKTFLIFFALHCEVQI